ncbi:MAG: LPS-assembly protein LptD, partial [Hyphomicrobiaceae bacterium]
MRQVHTPQGSDNGSATPGRSSWAALVAGVCAVSVAVCAGLPTVQAQVQTKEPSPTYIPSLTGDNKKKNESSFPKTKIIGPVRKIDKTQPLYLQGDELIYDTRANRVTARGNVEIFFSNYILTADEVIYDQSAHTLTAAGNVTLKEPNGLITRSDRIVLTDDFRDGFVQSLSVKTSDDTRISAERASRREGSITEFKNAKFTPCKSDPGKPPLWCIGASRIVQDQAKGTITYQDAWFEVLGTPILYLPYFQHADPSVKRRSGFLLPEFSSSSTLGFSVEIPYYFALAPNYDFTFHPKYMTDHGVLWQGDWRHKVAFGGITGQYS